MSIDHIQDVVPRTPASGPITCQPWCRYGDGHPDADFTDEQTCSSEGYAVDLPNCETYIDDSGVWTDIYVMGLSNRTGSTLLDFSPEAGNEFVLTRAEWEDFKRRGDAQWALTEGED